MFPWMIITTVQIWFRVDPYYTGPIIILGADCGSDQEPLLPNSDFIEEKWGKPLNHSGMT